MTTRAGAAVTASAAGTTVAQQRQDPRVAAGPAVTARNSGRDRRRARTAVAAVTRK